MRGAPVGAPADADEHVDADEPVTAARPPGDAPAPDLSRLRRHTWCGSVGLVYGLGAFVAVAVVANEGLGARMVLAVGGAGCGAVASARLLQHRLRRGAEVAGVADPSRWRLVALAVAGAIAFVIAAQMLGGVPIGPDGSVSWFAIPGVATGAIAAALFRRRRLAVVAVGGAVATLLALVAGLVGPGAVAGVWLAVDGALVVVVGVALVSQLHHWELMVRLDRARHTESELAVANERLRFAADLHDVQGHHLQVIALKSELATRLADDDPAAAAGHMSDVQEHARAALADTRAVVQAYRRASLGAELANATRVLTAAGVDGRLDVGTAEAAEDVVEPAAHLLGLVVREATTNVLRHSDAAQARFALRIADGHAELEVANDGCPAPSTERGGPDAWAPGSGLSALAQRLATAGGDLQWQRQPERFVVTARIPADTPPAPTSARAPA